MADKVLIVVDAQNDFITGSLGTEKAVKALENIKKELKKEYDLVGFTYDCHSETGYLNSQEGTKLPVLHCIYGTEGFELAIPLDKFRRRKFMVYKDSFGYSEWEGTLKEKATGGIESITLVGFCTDICVISNALIIKACFPEVPVKVVAKCCSGSTPELHKMALKVMAANQIEII